MSEQLSLPGSPYPKIPPEGRVDDTRGFGGITPTDARNVAKSGANSKMEKPSIKNEAKTTSEFDVEVIEADEELTAQEYEERISRGSSNKNSEHQSPGSKENFVGGVVGDSNNNEGSNKKEKVSQRSFEEIQLELISLINSPDPIKQKDLQRERAKLIREAKDAGVFDTVKVHMEKVQLIESYPEARRIIQGINVENAENEAEGLKYWNKNYEGMLREYVDVAILNMDLALAEAGGGNYPDDADRNLDIANLKRQIDVRGWGISPANLKRLAREYINPTTPQQQNNDEVVKVLKNIESIQQLQALSQEQQVELMKRGYDGLIQILDSNAPMDPRTYKLNLPLWYNRESSEFRSMVDFMANANYIASVKRTCKGPSEVFELPLSLNTRDMEYMWSVLPGFKEAMATMVSDIFDPTVRDRFVISGNKANFEKGIDSVGGYSVLESDTSILEYKDRLATKIGQILDRRGVDLSDRFRGVNNKDHAIAAVATAFNTLYCGGAFDSGDEKNDLNPGQPTAVTLSFRMLMMPGARGESKWLTNRKIDKGVYEEDFGGPIGRYLRWNASHTPGFADKIRREEVKYLPKRMLFSMFEHETFASTSDGGKSRFAGKNLAEALTIISQEARTQGGIKVPAEKIGFNDIEKGGDMFTSYVANAASYVLPVFDHLTSNDPKKRLNGEAAINLIIKCRKDERLRKIFYGSEAEDMITAIAGLAASPEGFEVGTDKLLLKLPESDYLSNVAAVANDDRLFVGMPTGFRERMIKKLNAPELLSASNELIMELLPFLFNTKVNTRESIRREARKNRSKI